MMASSESEEAVLQNVAENRSISVDEVFSMSNARHREVLARHSKQPGMFAEMVGMDDGKYDAAIAGNEHTPADVLASLALSDNIGVRRSVAGNKNAALATIEILMQDDDEVVKLEMARNPSTPLHILEALATDEDNNVRTAVMENSASPEKLLMTMLADPANANLDLEELYCNKNLTLPCLVDVIGKQLERDGVLSGDLREALFEQYERFESIKDAIPEGTAVALSKCNVHSLRKYSMEIPSLPVVDILRLVEDPELDDVSDYLIDNPLLQVAVDKLSQLLSKDMVGSDSHFDGGEQWW